MSDFIKTWLLNIMFVSVVGTAAYYLLPEGKMEKGLKTVISLCVLFVMLSPLASVVGTEISLPNIEEFLQSDTETAYAYEINSAMQADFTRILNAQISSILEENGAAESSETKIHTDINEDSRIIINGIDIYIEAEAYDSAEKIRKEIKEIAGIEPKIFVN